MKAAKSELDKHNKAITDLDRKYKDMKNKREQLSDETEQLKVGGNNSIMVKSVSLLMTINYKLFVL